jgi:hypothetical protein
MTTSIRSGKVNPVKKSLCTYWLSPYDLLDLLSLEFYINRTTSECVSKTFLERIRTRSSGQSRASAFPAPVGIDRARRPLPPWAK